MTSEKKSLGTTELGLQPNAAALLSYLLWFITGIIFIVLERKNKFVRFHALQSIIVFGFLFGLGIILPFIPLMGWFLIPIVWITSLILWVILMVKAYQGELFKLPVVGDIAEKSS
ncbi:DUF4870 domain-containing protein [Candidatus Omnitrophota bacterium]